LSAAAANSYCMNHWTDLISNLPWVAATVLHVIGLLMVVN
jgi:hypothetical protein